MKKFLFFFIFILYLINLSFSQGFGNLSKKSAESIKSFFIKHKNEKFSIINIDNRSELTDIEVQNLYQQIISKFDNEEGIYFSDLFLSFSDNKGTFDKSRFKDLDYFITLKLINAKGKIGLGVIIFSKKFDRIVFTRYFEEFISRGEKSLLKHYNYAFKDSGYSKKYEIKVRNNLIDVLSINLKSRDGVEKNILVLFYYDKFSLYKFNEDGLIKISDNRINWKRPLYSVFHYEGRSSFFKFNGKNYISIGSNISRVSKLYRIDSETLEINHYGDLKIVPISKILFNGEEKIVGARYNVGKNYFSGKLFLMDLSKTQLVSNEIYEKSIPEFYSISISTDKNNLKNIYIIDLNYRLRVLDGLFENILTSKKRYGYASGMLGNKWLVLSSYTQGPKDTLFFVKTNNLLTDDPVYSNETEGEIKFISGGYFGKNPGIWIKTGLSKNSYFENFKLQFWSKNVE